MKSKFRSMIGGVAVLLGGLSTVSASTITYDFGQTSGGSSPADTAPWLQAVFSDTAANTVQLTLTAANLTSTEFLSCWYFNLNPTLDPTGLSFVTSGSTGLFTDPTIQTGANNFKAGPDGKFDILLTFATSGGNSTQFSSGDSLTFTITGISGLTADDFNFLSGTSGGSAPYSSAAHIQGIEPGDKSGWINPTSTLLNNSQQQLAVPDGATTVSLLGASFIALETLRRKMQTRSSSR